MKNWITYFTSLLLATTLTTGCQQGLQVTGESEEGGLSISLSTSDETVVGTKTDDEQTSSPLYSIDITRTSTDELVAQYPDHTQLPTSISLSVGGYTISATSGDKEVAQFDVASYFGSSEVTIVAEKTATAQIEASLTNVVFTSNLDATINENFTQADLIIYDKQGGDLIFTIGKDDQGRLAYLPVLSSYYWVLALTNTQGSQYMLDGTITDAEIRYRYDFNFEITSESTESEGVQKVKISIDKNLVESEHSIEITTVAGSGVAPSVSSDDVEPGQTIYVNSTTRNTSAEFVI
ncbi:MAG: DUF4493 domain-containing protein, partial [Rikenellaceae bacterium]